MKIILFKTLTCYTINSRVTITPAINQLPEFNSTFMLRQTEAQKDKE